MLSILLNCGAELGLAGCLEFCRLEYSERPLQPEQGFRACRGILCLLRAFGRERLEAAAARAIDIDALSYGSVRRSQAGSSRRAQAPADSAPILHQNIRVARYHN
jgi:transposase